MTTARSDRKGVRFLSNGLKVYYVPRWGVLSGCILPNVFGGFCLLRAILIREGITIVHGHQSCSPFACQCIFQAQSMGFKCVFTDHSLFGFADLSGIALNKTLKCVMANVDHVICVSHTSKQNTVIRACIPPSRVSVIPNAVDAQDFEPDDSRVFDPEHITIVAFTRLVYRKGIDLLAVILPEICERHPHVHFHICGDGPKKKLLEEVIFREDLSSRVALHPAVPHSKARGVLIQGDVFINASLTEAFCIAIVEAAAAGLVVVSTRVGGVPEVLPPDMLILADPTPDSLIEAVETALRRVGYIDRREQHRHIAEMYSWWRVAERTESVYDVTVESQREDTLADDILRLLQCGPVAGVIFALLAMALRIVAMVVEWWRPSASIEVVPDFAHQSGARTGQSR